MTWFLVVALSLIALLAVLAAVGLAVSVGDEAQNDRAQIEAEVRRAERRLHALARNSFEAMLSEARSRDGIR